MTFTPENWICLSLAIGLQSYAVWKLKSCPSLRWLMAFYILRDLVGIAVHGSPMHYWDVFWYSGQICDVWWVWIACQLSFPEMTRFARIPPFVAICVFASYSPLTSLYSELKYAEAHVYAIALVAVLVGFISGLVAEKWTRWALGIALVLGCLTGFALWAWHYGSARIYQEGWIGILAVLLLCESGNQGLSGKNHPPTVTD